MNTGKSSSSLFGSKYANKNLNLTVKSNSRTNFGSGRGNVLYVLQGDKARVGKTIGAAAAPLPINTPLRNDQKPKEIPLNSQSSSVWQSQPPSEAKFEDNIPSQTVKTIPWSKPTTSSENNPFVDQPPTNKSAPTTRRNWADDESEEEDEEEDDDEDVGADVEEQQPIPFPLRKFDQREPLPSRTPPHQSTLLRRPLPPSSLDPRKVKDDEQRALEEARKERDMLEAQTRQRTRSEEMREMGGGEGIGGGGGGGYWQRDRSQSWGREKDARQGEADDRDSNRRPRPDASRRFDKHRERDEREHVDWSERDKRDPSLHPDPHRSFASLFGRSLSEPDHTGKEEREDERRRVLFDPKSNQMVEVAEDKNRIEKDKDRSPRRRQYPDEKPRHWRQEREEGQWVRARAPSDPDSQYDRKKREDDESEAQKRKSLRDAERHSRGPRTRGLLYRYTSPGMIELVPDKILAQLSKSSFSAVSDPLSLDIDLSSPPLLQEETTSSAYPDFSSDLTLIPQSHWRDSPFGALSPKKSRMPFVQGESSTSTSDQGALGTADLDIYFIRPPPAPEPKWSELQDDIYGSTSFLNDGLEKEKNPFAAASLPQVPKVQRRRPIPKAGKSEDIPVLLDELIIESGKELSKGRGRGRNTKKYLNDP